MGCSPSVLDAALLAPVQLRLCTWNVQCNMPCELLNVCAHNMLWAVKCLGAPCTVACAVHTCAQKERASSMLDLHQSGQIPSLQAFKLSSHPKMAGV